MFDRSSVSFGGNEIRVYVSFGGNERRVQELQHWRFVRPRRTRYSLEVIYVSSELNTGPNVFIHCPLRPESIGKVWKNEFTKPYVNHSSQRSSKTKRHSLTSDHEKEDNGERFVGEFS